MAPETTWLGSHSYLWLSRGPHKDRYGRELLFRKSRFCRPASFPFAAAQYQQLAGISVLIFRLGQEMLSSGRNCSVILPPGHSMYDIHCCNGSRIRHLVDQSKGDIDSGSGQAVAVDVMDAGGAN